MPLPALTLAAAHGDDQMLHVQGGACRHVPAAARRRRRSGGIVDEGAGCALDARA